MNRIGETWSGLSPSYPAEISFLDKKLEQLYRKENLESQLFVLFSVISIIIACLGSFALAAFSAEERTKEIGIRKILGSSIFSIFIMLTKDFIKLIVIAIIIASPLAWFFMQQWLQDFAYRTDISQLLFINAALITIVLVLITVSWQALKAGRINPIESLRYE